MNHGYMNQIMVEKMTTSKRGLGGPKKSKLVKNLERYARQAELRVSGFSLDIYKSPQDCAPGYIRRIAYDKTLAWRAADRMQSIKDKLRALGYAPSGSLADVDFAWLPTAIFRILGQEGKAVSNRVRVIARDLAYADQNGVPAEYLIGFIHSVGGSKMIEKLHAVKKGSGPAETPIQPDADRQKRSARPASNRRSRRRRNKSEALLSRSGRKVKRRADPAR